MDNSGRRKLWIVQVAHSGIVVQFAYMVAPFELGGQVAPEFSLPDQDGKKHSLSDYRGKWVLIFFYPQDDTPGCTKQACAIRDMFSDFEKLSAVVLGVSVDSVESHKQFAEKYKLPFTILADEDKAVSMQYGVLGKSGKALRTSFLINPEGVVTKVHEDVNPEEHASMILDDLEAMRE